MASAIMDICQSKFLRTHAVSTDSIIFNHYPLFSDIWIYVIDKLTKRFRVLPFGGAKVDIGAFPFVSVETPRSIPKNQGGFLKKSCPKFQSHSHRRAFIPIYALVAYFAEHYRFSPLFLLLDT